MTVYLGKNRPLGCGRCGISMLYLLSSPCLLLMAQDHLVPGDLSVPMQERKVNEGHKQADFVYDMDSSGVIRALKLRPPAVGGPSVISGTPTSATGSPQNITVVGSDPDGWANIHRIYFLVHRDGTIPQYSCHGFYDRPSGAFYLYDDAITAFVGSPPALTPALTAGASGIRKNSQCQINGSASQASGSGDQLTLNMNMTLLGGYSLAVQRMYFWIVDHEGNGTGWVQTGTWNVPGGLQPPVVLGATPTASPHATQTFSATVRDPNGANNLWRLYFQIGPTAALGPNGCHGFYDRPSNTVYLYNDALTIPMGPVVLGTSSSVANSQCTVLGSLSCVVVNTTGTDFVLTLGLGVQGAYAQSSKNVYFWAVDHEGYGTGWVQTATWNSTGGGSQATWSGIGRSQTQFYRFPSGGETPLSGYDFNIPYPTETNAAQWSACTSGALQYTLFNNYRSPDSPPPPSLPEEPYPTWRRIFQQIVSQGPTVSPQSFYAGQSTYYLSGLRFNGAFGGRLSTNEHPEGRNSLVQAIFVHQRDCYDGGPEFGFYRIVRAPFTIDDDRYLRFYYSDKTNCFGEEKGMLNNPSGPSVTQGNCKDQAGNNIFNLVSPSETDSNLKLEIPQWTNSQGAYDWEYSAVLTGLATFEIKVIDPYTRATPVEPWSGRVFGAKNVTVECFFKPYTGQMWSGQFWGKVSVVHQKGFDYTWNTNIPSGLQPVGSQSPDTFNYPGVRVKSMAVCSPSGSCVQ